MKAVKTIFMAGLFLFAVSLLLTAGAYEGYAPLTSGGEGGGTIWVKNLNDSGADSFRAALAALDGSPTIIKFSVSGTINLLTKTGCYRPNVTIAGETAPGAGITLSGATITGLEPIFEINTNDVIVRHLRVRNSPKEGIQVTGDYNIIVDHCSITGSLDGGCDVNGGSHHVVFSRNLVAENVEGHRTYGESTSFHHNLYTDNNRRQPKIVCVTGPFDFRNNVVEYWTNTGTNCEDTGGINIINNWYGPPAPGENWDYSLIIGALATDTYVAGNYCEGDPDINSEGNQTEPATEPDVVTMEAGPALVANVKHDCGAMPRDAVDEGYAGPAYTAPVADAGPDKNVYQNAVVTFDGSGSTGSIISYFWEFGDGATRSGRTVTHVYASTGDYTVTLTVSDGQASDDDTCQVTVQTPVTLAAEAGPDKQAVINTTVIFDGSGSIGNITSYVWEFGDGATRSGVTATHSYGQIGSYTATLTVNDGQGTDDDTCRVTIQTPPSNPTITFSAGATAGWNLRHPAVLLETIYGTQQDASGNITTNNYRYLSIDKGLAYAFTVGKNCVLDSATLKCRGVKASNGIRVRMYNVTGQNYLNYSGHPAPARTAPGGSGNNPLFDLNVVTSAAVPSHLEGTVAYTDMNIDFDSMWVTSGEYFLVFDAGGPSNTWGNFVRGLEAEVDGMGKFPDGSPLPGAATVTKSTGDGNTYYYLLESTGSANYSVAGQLFSFQLLEEKPVHSLSGTVSFKYPGWTKTTAPVMYQIRNPGLPPTTPVYSGTLTVTVTPGNPAGGAFTIADIVDGTYDVALKHANHAADFKSNVVLSGGNLTGLAFSLWSGDADGDNNFNTVYPTDTGGDNDVDIKDYYTLYYQYQGSKPITASYNADYNSDGTVNVLDYNGLKYGYLNRANPGNWYRP